MNFVAKWCMDHCGRKRDCTICTVRYCIPRERLSDATECSTYLLGILQSMSDAVTHPNIADRLADYIGATSEERDQIVAKKHHGTYVPGKSVPPPKSDPYVGWSARAVVAVNRYGTELERFVTAVRAGDRFDLLPATVITRCKRKLTTNDEFEPIGVTFRYADEWDSMTDEERAADLNGHINKEEGDEDVQND